VQKVRKLFLDVFKSSGIVRKHDIQSREMGVQRDKFIVGHSVYLLDKHSLRQWVKDIRLKGRTRMDMTRMITLRHLDLHAYTRNEYLNT
jgi:hypothetical protein